MDACEIPAGERYANPMPHERFLLPWPPENYWKDRRCEECTPQGERYAARVAEIVEKTRRAAHMKWLAEKYPDLDRIPFTPLDNHRGPTVVTVRFYVPEDRSDAVGTWLARMGAIVVSAADRAAVWSVIETYAIRIDRGAPPSKDPHVELLVDTVEIDDYPGSYTQ